MKFEFLSWFHHSIVFCSFESCRIWKHELLEVIWSQKSSQSVPSHMSQKLYRRIQSQGLSGDTMVGSFASTALRRCDDIGCGWEVFRTENLLIIGGKWFPLGLMGNWIDCQDEQQLASAHFGHCAVILDFNNKMCREKALLWSKQNFQYKIDMTKFDFQKETIFRFFKGKFSFFFIWTKPRALGMKKYIMNEAKQNISN